MSQIDLALEAVLNKIKEESPQSLHEAEQQANQWELENLPGYSYSLAMYMANPQKGAHNRQLCGILLKGTIWSKSAAENLVKQQRWFEKMPEQAKAKIRITLYTLLNDPVSQVANTAAQIIAKIAIIEVPRGQWTDLIGALLQNMTNPQASTSLKKATLETLGYICEEINSDVLTASANQILTAVIQGMRPEEKSRDVKLAACNALLLSLDFSKKAFEKEKECAWIFESVLSLMEYPDEEIKFAAYAVLTEIAEQYYDKLPTFMVRIFKITLESIAKGPKEEDLCKMAMEFWSTICDEESAIAEEILYNQENGLPPPEKVSQFYVKGALQYLVPLLTKCLTVQEEDDDPDDYTIAMAAGICLNLVAQTVKDDVVGYVKTFIEENILSPDWKCREAAVMSFGSILEGANKNGVIVQLIAAAAPVLVKNLKDPSPSVKDTSAWTIATILKLHPEGVVPLAENILQNLCETLGDPEPRVAAKACLGVFNFAISFQGQPGNPIGVHFVDVVRMLLLCADRPEADEENLRVSAYEALNVVLDTAPSSCDEALGQVLKVMVERLEKTFQMEILSQDDVNVQNELQGLLCGVLQVLVTRLGARLKPLADLLMKQLIFLFSSKKDASVYEEAMLTVTAIVTVTEGDFLRYMDELNPYILAGLSNWQAHQVCNIAVGIIGDISRNIGSNMARYCDDIVTVLVKNLQNRELDRAVKPTILSVFGDIAWSIGSHFEKFLQFVMHMLKQAGESVMKTQLTEDDYELIDYLNQLREAICVAYTGINQGMRADNKADKMNPYFNDIMQFVLHIATEKQCSESVKRSACGIVGDMVVSFGLPKVKPAVQHDQIQQLLVECQQTADYSKETRELATWALQLSRGM